MPAHTATGTRLDWSRVPERVREAVDEALGSPVAHAATQTGGFSPGAAARLRLADGRAAFVKACGAALNPDTPDLNRAEVVALSLLPPDVPAPRLIASYDDGDWVALVLEDVDGHRPQTPWAQPDVDAVTSALTVLSRTTAHQALPTFDNAALALSAWDDVATDPAGIDPGLLARLPELLDLQARAQEVTVGSSLVHWDARNDNILVRPDGEAVLLDWAWACRGAPWLDTLLLATDFRIQGGPDADAYLRCAEPTREVPGEDLRAVIACMVGVWSERARRPAPPGLPTIRPWQANCAAAALRWMDDGTAWTGGGKAPPDDRPAGPPCP
jgi:hypothetical protein